ncbi:MAG: winged helix-turn-helix transcriptional regulator [Longimicrobiales bacterium]
MTQKEASARSSCPISCALDLLGDRWTLLVVRDLLLRGRRHFEHFASDESIATNILADRLERLEDAGVLTKHRDPDDGRRRLYAPTPRGVDLIPTLLEIGLWGDQHTEYGQANALLLRRTRSDRDALVAELREQALNPSE